MEYKDYYRTLGVPRDADSAAIRSAYRKLARELHPDRNPDDPAAEERFKEVAEAYEVLGDPRKRARYDRVGRGWDGRPPGPGAGGQRVSPQDLDDILGQSGFSDFFEALFGRGAGRPAGGRPGGGAARRGGDLRQTVPVTLEEAARGTERLVNVGGRRIEVKIPPGVRSGSKVRVRGEGGAAPAGGGAKGDLFLIIDVLPHARFSRAGDDLTVRVPVPLWTLALGGEVDVETLDGRIHLAIPEGTRPGRRFRLAGRGLPSLRDPARKGDLFALVEAELPEDLDEEERAFLARMRERRAGA